MDLHTRLLIRFYSYKCLMFFLYCRTTSTVSSGRDLLSKQGSYHHDEWHTDLLDCCSEPCLCMYHVYLFRFCLVVHEVGVLLACFSSIKIVMNFWFFLFLRQIPSLVLNFLITYNFFLCRSKDSLLSLWYIGKNLDRGKQ